MRTRLNKARDERDQGFTLIELLVVIIIIGILAAIAIPVFLNQRKKGVDASLKSDLKNAATVVETWATDNPSLAVPGVAEFTGTGSGTLSGFKTSPNNQVTLVASGTVGAYCIFAYNSGATAATGAGAQLAYVSQSGGLQAAVVAATTCT